MECPVDVIVVPYAGPVPAVRRGAVESWDNRRVRLCLQGITVMSG